MEPKEIDKPFRFSTDFVIACFVLAFPALLTFKPWNWDIPFLSKAVAFVFIPFASGIVFYVPIMFVRAALRSGARGWYVVRVFISVLLGAVSVFTILFIKGGFEPIDGIAVFIVSAWAYFMIAWKIGR